MNKSYEMVKHNFIDDLYVDLLGYMGQPNDKALDDTSMMDDLYNDFGKIQILMNDFRDPKRKYLHVISNLILAELHGVNHCDNYIYKKVVEISDTKDL